MSRSCSQHSGTSLIELLIFLAILSLVVAVSLPVFFSASANRVLQQTVSIVEQNGTQILQNITLRVKGAQRILLPPLGETGSLLVLETSSGALSPVIIGVQSGSLVIVDHTTRQTITSSQVAVLDFAVRNTSASASRQSASLSFRVSRTIRLQQPRSYAKVFEATIGLPPDDTIDDHGCVCDIPVCLGNNVFQWEVCEQETCYRATTPIKCP